MTHREFTEKYGYRTVSLVLRHLADKADIPEPARAEAHQMAKDLEDLLSESRP